jgi:hypothetical protein
VQQDKQQEEVDTRSPDPSDFNSSDSAYASRGLTSNGNRKTWTWAGWVKSTNQGFYFLNAQGSSPAKDDYFVLRLISNGKIFLHQRLTEANKQFELNTSSYYRDPSAWYHFVFAFDTTNSTASDRIKLYVNGERVTSFETANYPTYGYLADIHFIDGQALDPTSFGEFDTNGVWQPIDASGLTLRHQRVPPAVLR